MEVAIVGKNSLKIRSKTAGFAVSPTSDISKIEADVVLSLNENLDSINTSKVADFRLIISGPGEYEISGVKISSNKKDSGIVYKVNLDKMDVVLGKASTIAKLLDDVDGSQVAIIEADELPTDKAITTLQANLVIFYGEKAQESAKMFKEGTEIVTVGKFSMTSEKLPEEMQVVVLA